MIDLDHIAVMASDLDALSARYQRLGFRLTARSQHQGSLAPGKPPVPWGTGNRCAMLRSGYIELLGIVDPTLYLSGVPQFLARYEGIHIIAFGCRDADAHAARLGLAGATPLAREVEVDGAQATLRFSLVRPDPATYGEGLILVIEHQTRQLLWHPPLLEHPNGALELLEVVIAVSDVAEAAERYAQLLECRPEVLANGTGFALAPGRLVLTSAQALPDWLAGASAPTLPFIAGYTVSVRDLAHTERLLSANGIAAARAGDAVVVPADEAGGASLRFVAAGA